MDKPNPLNSCYFCQDERIIIADMLKHNASIRKISQRLGRGPFGISREVRANTHPDNRSYEPYRAHQISHQRLKRPKTPKILANPVMFALVEKYLKTHWTPARSRLTKMYPDNESMHACSETIYQAIYIHASTSRQLGVDQVLRSGRAKRRPRHLPLQRTPRLSDPMAMIVPA